jgi:3-hydroxyisobutyrate dehydrogenase-like beta-hydroxyacid dehydrogenase
MNIAFIGTGNMGLPMLANLLKKGFSAVAYDIVPAALDRAVAQGAMRGGSRPSLRRQIIRSGRE